MKIIKQKFTIEFEYEDENKRVTEEKLYEVVCLEIREAGWNVKVKEI